MKKINNNKISKLFLIFNVIMCFFLLTSCNDDKEIYRNEIINNVTNDITNNVVTVTDFSINDLEDALEIAYQKVSNACVGIVRKYKTTVSNIEVWKNDAIGSGVIYKRIENKNSKGNLENYTYYLMTNRHVILGTDSTKEYQNSVFIQKENLYLPLTLIGYDEKVDLACLTFQHSTFIEPVKFGDSDEIKSGNFTFAVGCPKGFEYYNSMTFGIISSPLRYLLDDTDNDGVNDFVFEYIQLDCAINPGNSGGGLFNINGELIGINTMKLASVDIDSMGFSIPINVIENLLTNFIETNQIIIRPRLGVSGYDVFNLTDYTIISQGLVDLPNIYNGLTPYGIYVSKVIEDGTMASSNLKEDDILLEIDNVKIINNYIVPAMFNSLIDYHVGDEVTIKYYSRINKEIVTEKVILKSI